MLSLQLLIFFVISRIPHACCLLHLNDSLDFTNITLFGEQLALSSYCHVIFSALFPNTLIQCTKPQANTC